MKLIIEDERISHKNGTVSPIHFKVEITTEPEDDTLSTLLRDVVAPALLAMGFAEKSVQNALDIGW